MSLRLGYRQPRPRTSPQDANPFGFGVHPPHQCLPPIPGRILTFFGGNGTGKMLVCFLHSFSVFYVSLMLTILLGLFRGFEGLGEHLVASV